MSVIGFGFFFVFLFGILIYGGLAVLFVFLCRNMAREKGLPDTWMWFGLLGVIGILIVAVKDPVRPPYTYNPYGQNPQYGPGGYVQNPQYGQTQQYGQFAQQQTYNPNMQYQQPQANQNQQVVQTQGYNLNGVQHTESSGTTCSFCGMKVSGEVKECPVCGSKVN